MNSRMGAACLGLLLITGCSSGSIEKDARYDDVMDLRDAYVASEAIENPSCKDEPTQDAMAEQGWQAITCGSNTVMLITDSAAVLHEMNERDTKYLEPRQRILTGPNWSIRGPQFDIERLQEALGGEIIQPL